MFKINKKTIMLINTLTNYNILASNGKFIFQGFVHPTGIKIYKFKDHSAFKNAIDEHFKKFDTLNYKQIQEYIKTLQNYKEIEILDIKNGENIENEKYYIVIKEDPKEVFLQRKKCILNFFCKSYELEDKFKNPIEIEFSETVNSDTNIVDYIKDKYKVKSFSDDDFSMKEKETSNDVLYYKKRILLDGEYTIELNKHVEGITKKKEDDNVNINIEIVTDKPDEFKVRDSINKNKKIVLKKGSCKIKDLLTILKNNGYNGIEQKGIIKEIFLDTNPTNNILKSNEDLIAGQYKILLSGQENDFVEKKTTNKKITLTIVPKDETNYKLKGISDNVPINVPENISYSDFVNEVKKKITDGKFEIYVDNNKVEDCNIDINKKIIIKLLDDCNKLEKNEKKEDNNNNNNNNNDNNNNDNTQTKQKKYCEGKYGKK